MTSTNLGEIAARLGVGRRFSEVTFRSALQNRSILTDEQKALEWLHELRFGPRHLFWIEEDRGFCESLVASFPEETDRIISDARQISDHKFDLLGSGPKDLGPIIDWHADFQSGMRWSPDVYFKRVRMDAHPGNDILVPWWLSSFYHFIPLGLAYRISHEQGIEGAEGYVKEFVGQIQSWCRANPYPFGVNWASTTIVAIRLIHWIWAFILFREASSISLDFWRHFLRQVFLHVRHIERNLEWFPVRTNHYLVNVLSILYAGLIFPEFRDSKRWVDFAHAQIVGEISHHVYEDGVTHEGSLNYHRFVTEIFLTALLLGKNHGLEYPAEYMERLEGMLDFICSYTRPDGTAPMIGDAAPITVQNLLQGDLVGDHRWLLAVGAVVFSRADFADVSGKPPLAVHLLFGTKGIASYNALERPSMKGARTLSTSTDGMVRTFRTGGFFIYRDSALYLLIRCGRLPLEGVKSHGHQDQLSFECCVNGDPLIIDPGWYRYESDPKMLHHFRATRAHNTVTVDDRNQMRVEVFAYPPPDRPNPRCLEWMETPEELRFRGEHELYGDLDDPVVHEREIRLYRAERRLEIVDHLRGSDRHRLEWNLPFAADVEVSIDVETVTAISGSGATTRIIWHGARDQVRLERGWVAPMYGRKRLAPVLRILREGVLPQSTLMTIEIEMPKTKRDAFFG